MVSRGVEVVGNPAIVGKNHLRFKARQNGSVFDCIGYNLGHLTYRLTPGESNLDMAYVIEENEWRGRNDIQLRLRGQDCVNWASQPRNSVWLWVVYSVLYEVIVLRSF